MNLHILWEAVVVVLTAMLLLRISGRKSIAQMSVPTTIIMISIGAIIVQPIIEDSVLNTILAVTVFIITLIVIEYLQLKFNRLEKLFTGKAKIVINNGQIVHSNLKKMRITIDKLEMQLRINGISNISDVKNGTIEPNGQFGYELMPDAKPLTVGEFKKLMGMPLNQEQPLTDGTLFYEVKQEEHLIPHSEEYQ